MSVAAAQITVGTSATQLQAREGDGHSLCLRNAGAVDVYLGASDVTTSTGFKLAAGETMALDLLAAEAVYGIVASGSCIVHVLGVSVG
jgi:hypothetical protein